MLRDYSFQPTCDSWVVVVFTFILDLKYNKEYYINSRRDFLKNLATYLTISYINNRAKVTNLKSVTISAINDVLESCGVSVLRDDPENQDLPNNGDNGDNGHNEDNGDLPNEGRDMKCNVCIKNL